MNNQEKISIEGIAKHVSILNKEVGDIKTNVCGMKVDIGKVKTNITWIRGILIGIFVAVIIGIINMFVGG